MEKKQKCKGLKYKQERLYKQPKEGTSGITLVALVVTIVVLIILATITINIALNGGIADKAEEAKKLYEDSEQREQAGINALTDHLGKMLNDAETGGIQDPESSLQADGSFDGKVNSPKLAKGMTAITWDEKSQQWVEPETNEEWYNYDEKKWANAQTADGSYWVWIPRYAYKITSGYHQRF